MKKYFEKFKKEIQYGFCFLIGIILTYNIAYSIGYNKGLNNIAPNIIYIDDSVEVKHMPFLNQTAKEGLKDALSYYNIKNKDIVYAQAILETGNFKSTICTKNNNLFGLYDSRKKEYFKYSHWSQSVEAYKKYIQKKYKSGDYYMFLTNLGYAEDSTYINKLKETVKKMKK